MRLPGRKDIELSCIDMWVPYKEAIPVVLPNAKIVIDRFHVVKMANEAVETVRKAIRETLSESQRRQLMHDRFLLLHRPTDLDVSKQLILEAWLENMPVLKAVYQRKEAFYDIYQAKTRKEALELYQAWKRSIPSDLEYAFRPLLTAVENWQNEIFNFFTGARITAGFTENLNGRVKLMQKNGRGYSFETLRMKVLQTMGPKNVRI